MVAGPWKGVKNSCLLAPLHVGHLRGCHISLRIWSLSSTVCSESLVQLRDNELPQVKYLAETFP